MYNIGLFNSLGATLLFAASKNQIDYITELARQYPQHGDSILDMFMHRNAATYLSMIAARCYGFEMKICYDLVGWSGLERVPEKDYKRVAILHLAEMIDFYDRGMVDFYQIDKKALKLFNIQDEVQFKKLVKDLQEGYQAYCSD